MIHSAAEMPPAHGSLYQQFSNVAKPWTPWKLFKILISFILHTI